jgi:light-regulated signal transduction histidine kinase (bacteriophytochrome)
MDLEKELAKARETIKMLQEELAESNKGMVVLTLELEKKAAELELAKKLLEQDLAESSSGIMALTLELESKVVELEHSNEKIQSEIDERKRAEGELRNHRDHLEELVTQRTAELERRALELERSNRDLEQFAYVASHDLQEPLRMVASYTQLLEKRYRDHLDQDAKEFIMYAVDGANRMQSLINDLLSYSRVTTRGKEPELTDSHSALGQAIANLRALIDENQAVITNGDLPEVVADQTQLIQVFQNLISNAIRFRAEENPRIHVSAEHKDGECIFSVKDNGIGIELQYKERIFVIFQRLHGKTEYPGTGIGLPLCKRIVERHGGRIWFDSERGKGSTFYFTMGGA